MEILQLLEIISKDANCKVFPSVGKPELPNNIQLPQDLAQFYELCGGVYLFETKEYAIKIVEPEKFVRANPIIILEEGADDNSFDWFIIAHDLSSQYITIDLSEEKKGRCYDSFWEIHASMGNQPIIARSFTQLLANLYENKGQYWYWLREDFNKLGDAYD